MDLLYFLKVLFRKKWIIIGLTILATAATFFFVVNKKPLFVSVAQYSTGFTAEKVKLADGTSAIDLFSADVKFDNVIETIKSPQVISRISYSLLLHDISDPSKAYRKLTKGDAEKPLYKAVNIDTAKKILSEKLLDNQMLRSDINNEKFLLEYLKLYRYNYFSLLENLNTNRVQRTDYLDISFSSENPELSAWIVNAVGTEFLNYYRNLNFQRTDENAQSIKGLVENQQSKVDSLGRKLLGEKINQGAIDPAIRTKGAMETVTELETKLAEEKGKYNEHTNRLNYLKERLNTLQSGISGTSNDEVVKLTNKKNELVATLARKGGKDPAMEQQISDLRSEIILKSNSIVNKNKLKDNIDDISRQVNEEEALVNASGSTITDYNDRIHRYMSMTNSNPGSGVKMDVIRTQLDIENKQLSNVKERYTQVEGLSKDDPTSNFIQTRIGQPAAEPESKKTFVKMSLSGISVFLLSAVLFIFLEIFDSSVKTPAIFNKLSKIKISNVLNQVNFKTKSVTDIVMQDVEGKKYLQQNIFKNNIRKLRYELLNSGKKVFLFTSTQRGSGKTTVTEALATSLLLSKKKVLVIDLNFSNNSLTKQFNTEMYIQDVAQKMNYSLPVLNQKICAKTMYEDLYIIGCREGDITPSEALYNVDITAFLEALKKDFDFILIEGASLNYYADSKELAKYVDGIFTVFSANLSLSQVDNESMKFIADLREKNHGIILNKVLTENINS